MNKLFVLLAAFLGLSYASSVVELTGADFSQVVDGSKHVLVEFYAPWCGHCKNLAPAYEEVGEAFSKISDVVIAKVDADQHKEVGALYGIQGFPTLKFFPKGSKEPKAYEGGRTAEDLVNYVNKEARTNARLKKVPSNVVTLDPSNFDSIALDTTKDVLVEFYAPWCGHCKTLAPEYEKLANIFVNEEEVVIAKVDADAHKSLGSRFGVSGFPTIKFFAKDKKETPEDYQKSRDIPSFVEFINEKSGTEREANGRLKATSGRIESLDQLASKYLAGDKPAILKQTEELVKSLEGKDAKNGELYVKLMKAIQSKGNDFVTKESERVTRLIEGDISPKKLDEFSLRKNILAAFSS